MEGLTTSVSHDNMTAGISLLLALRVHMWASSLSSGLGTGSAFMNLDVGTTPKFKDVFGPQLSTSWKHEFAIHDDRNLRQHNLSLTKTRAIKQLGNGVNEL